MNNIRFDQEVFRKLREREIQVAQAAANGLGCQQTADELLISIHTVQVYRHSLIKKLNCGHIAGAVAIMIRGGIIH